MNNFNHRPPIFLRPSPCSEFGPRMPWGSPRPMFMRKTRPPYLRFPTGMSPDSLRLPSHMQPPPMFGPRGATIPPHLMGSYNVNNKFNHRDSENHLKFWCETCDRGFKTNDLFNKHKSEHQKCGIDGCEFTAHANVVTKHIQMQHSTGLYKKICNINTPEDIQNWVNERKRNYPSRENIEKKRAQQKECIDRGEKLYDNKERFNKNKRGRNNRSKNRNIHHNKQSQFVKTTIDKRLPKIPSSNQVPCKEKSTAIEEELYLNLKPFRGISQLARDDVIFCDNEISIQNDFDIEDDEWQDNNTTLENNEKNVTVCNALSSLIGAYESSDEEETKGSKSMANKDIFNQILEENDNTIDKVNIESKNQPSDNDESGPDELKIEKTQNLCENTEDLERPSSNTSTDVKCSRKRKHTADGDNSNLVKRTIQQEVSNKCINKNSSNESRNLAVRRKMPKTLLEKLLQKDIRTERNMVLQCVHYIVDNNFFFNI